MRQKLAGFFGEVKQDGVRIGKSGRRLFTVLPLGEITALSHTAPAAVLPILARRSPCAKQARNDRRPGRTLGDIHRRRRGGLTPVAFSRRRRSWGFCMWLALRRRQVEERRPSKNRKKPMRKFIGDARCSATVATRSRPDDPRIDPGGVSRRLVPAGEHQRREGSSGPAHASPRLKPIICSLGGTDAPHSRIKPLTLKEKRCAATQCTRGSVSNEK
jgi:hypothetical protein